MSFKILWYSIPTLLDSSNGAAIINRTLLNQLQKRGFEIRVVNCLKGDSELGLTNLKNILSQPQYNTPELQKQEYYSLNVDNIQYYILKTPNISISDITGGDQSRLFSLYTQVLNAYQPDLVMGYSGDAFSTVMWAEAKARKIPTIYSVCNAMHHTFAFKNLDLVIAPSKVICNYYKEKSAVDMHATGIFIDKERVIAPAEMKQSAQGSYITLINPEPNKGIAVFLKMAMVYLRRHPDSKQRFLIVKCRSDYNEIVSNIIWESNSEEYKQDVARLFAHVDVAEHTSDIRPVYANTKVLVAPSLCFESWGAVATEANFNGIPVLATSDNGLYEAIGEGKGGIVLPAPQSTMNNIMHVPSDSEIEPFVDALERLLNEDWSEGCAASAQYSDIDRNVDQFLEVITPLLEQGQKYKDHHQSFYFNSPTIERMYQQLNNS